MVFCRVFFQFIPWTLLVGFYGTIFVKVHHQETQMAAYASKMKVKIKKRQKDLRVLMHLCLLH